MWYSKIIEAATAWEVLSTKDVSWLGTFRKSFADFEFWKGSTKLPTVVALRKFIDSITRKSSTYGSTLDQYFENTDKWDLSADLNYFISSLITWADDYISKGKLDTELVYVLNFLGILHEKYQEVSWTKKPFTLGYASNDPNNTWAIKNSLSMGFTTLKLLYEKGIRLDPTFEIIIAQDRDFSLAGTSDTDDRKAVKRKILQNRPELKFFPTPQSVIEAIENYKSDEDQFVVAGFQPDFKTLFEFVKQFIQSSAKEFVKKAFIAWFDNENLKLTDILDNFIFDTYFDFYLDYKKSSTILNPNQEEALRSIRLKIFSYIDENKLALYKNQFMNDDEFMQIVKEREASDDLPNQYIFAGYASQETVVKFIEKNPEYIDHFIERGLLNNIEQSKKEAIIKQAKQKNEQTKKDSMVFLELAKSKGYIKIMDASEAFYNPAGGMKLQPSVYDEDGNKVQESKSEAYYTSYLDRLLEEAPFSGTEIDDLKAYASHMKIFEYDEPQLSNFASSKGIRQVLVGHVKLFGEGWSGLFVPRLQMPDGDIPAIFIKTNAYDLLEYHQQLSKSIGMRPEHFVESTRRHEIAHALQYLAVGNNMMFKSVVLNPEVTEEEAYLINPSEMYARVHGNIPYLLKIFDHHISDLKTDPKVYEAAKAQWVSEMEDSLVHLSSGGVNTRRLMEDIERERGHFGWITDRSGRAFKIPDPHEAVSKTLERQRQRLEEMFYELYQVQGRRDFRLSLLKRRKALRDQAEILDYESPQKVNIENELRKLDELIVASGQYLIFDVSSVSESVIEGYLTDYFGKLANAISEGLIDRDVVNPEGVDQLIEQTKEEGSKPEPPTSKDIRDIARSQIGFTEPIPSGRKLDVVLPQYKGLGRPEGYYPQDQKETGQSTQIKLTTDDDDDDQFKESKSRTKKSSFNFRRFKL
jgi:hypothetical protein